MKLDLMKEQIILVDGPARIELVSGECEAVGALLKSHDRIFIPKGKKIPIEGVTSSQINLSAEEGHVETIPYRTIPRSWDILVEKILKERPKSIFVIGEMDTGKSFFTTYMGNRLFRAGLSTAILDCDTGQSDIGPPGTFGLSYVKKPVAFLPQAPVDAMAFIGGHSPGMHFTVALSAFARMTRNAFENSDVLLINTSGWVQSDGGRAYKIAKMELCPPGLVVLLQRTDELEHLVKHIPEKNVFRLTVSKSATFTSPDVRKSLREEVSRAYMSKAKLIEISSFATMGAYYGTGKSVERPKGIGKEVVHIEKLSAWEGHLVVHKSDISGEAKAKVMAALPGKIFWVPCHHAVGALVGLLNQNGDCMGLGVIQMLKWEKRIAEVWTPIPHQSLKNVSIIQFGSIRLTNDGFEAGFLPPGTI
ncbi:MAG: hypothetical protein COS94_08975 [Candidatus Hydrogenedentes bacterium CG07_land_8_20_14_0_80_42_17]|nr:MAG: hypothetical protein COS94_08975 [Candidatus Hydrogenedentes bacterium CG07_land_8_20_14_0_80_42_17]